MSDEATHSKGKRQRQNLGTGFWALIGYPPIIPNPQSLVPDTFTLRSGWLIEDKSAGSLLQEGEPV